jgi:glycosyltransferase A (GT-A) superfamily protein (DUF2064 family)
MKDAFREAFNQDYEKVLIIEGDCGQLQPRYSERSYQMPDNHDVVLGPSKDGGYYLLGMNRFLPELFDNKPWITDQVSEQTLVDCQKRGYSNSLLEELIDVDTKGDWLLVKDQFWS